MVWSHFGISITELGLKVHYLRSVVFVAVYESWYHYFVIQIMSRKKKSKRKPQKSLTNGGQSNLKACHLLIAQLEVMLIDFD